MIERNEILNELKKVNYPGYSRNIVSFGLIGDITIQNSKVIITMKYTTQTPEIQKELEARINEQLLNTGKIKEITIKKDVQQTHTASTFAKKKVNATYVIAVASGKGGVGKSTVTAILGIVLSRLNYNVGILDSDVYGPSIPLILGINELPTVDESNKIFVPSKNNIKVISIGLLIPETEAVIWRGPMIYKALQQFLFDSDWGYLDILLVDLPPGTGDAPLSLSQLTEIAGVVIVTTPQRASVDVAKKSIFMFQKLQTKILGVIENMSYYSCLKCNEQNYIFGRGIVESLTKNINVPLLGKIPIDDKIIQLADKGNLFDVEKIATSTYTEYKKIATYIIQSLNNETLH